MIWEFYRTFLSPIVIAMLGVYLLGIGLRCILTSRPFLISGKWMFAGAIVPFLILAVNPLLFSLSYGPIDWLDWLPLLMFSVAALMFWHQTKGYIAFSITGKSFRSGLLAALEKLQLPYEESLSSIRLTSVEADLQVAVQSWMGTGQIKVRQAGHRPLLKRIVNGMNDCFRQGSMGTNRISWLFWVAVGLFALILGIDMYFP